MFIELEKFLKIAYENFVILHHNIVSPNYFADHEKMAEYYEFVAKMSDELVEQGIVLGYKEQSIVEALNNFDVIEVREYDKKEAYTLAKEMFEEIYNQIEQCKNEVPDYLKNILEEYEAKLVLESKFKLAHLLNSME